MECNCNHNSASCFYAHSPLWGGRGREGKIRTPLHRLFYNMHGISSLSSLAGCYYPICPRIFSCTMTKWKTSQLSSSSSDTESQEERALLFKMWILAILQHPQMHHQFKRQRQRKLTDLEKKTGAWRNNWNKLWVCSLTGIPNMMMMMSKMAMGGIEIGASLEHFKREDLSVILKQNWSCWPTKRILA